MPMKRTVAQVGRPHVRADRLGMPLQRGLGDDDHAVLAQI